jgi:hypothetical protein
LKPSVPAAERLAFPNATAVTKLPFPEGQIAFLTDLMAYTTTPRLLQTVAVVATPTANFAASTSKPSIAAFTGAGNAQLPRAGPALAVAVGVARYFV